MPKQTDPNAPVNMKFPEDKYVNGVLTYIAGKVYPIKATSVRRWLNRGGVIVPDEPKATPQAPPAKAAKPPTPPQTRKPQAPPVVVEPPQKSETDSKSEDDKGAGTP